MTIADKLTQLNTIKQDIKTAILNKGQTVTDDMTGYATAITNISGSAVINSLSVTPSTSAQTITAPVGVTGYNPINVSAVTSSIDNNITAGNIKKSVTILGTTGTYETTKYGCTINGILGDVDGNGVLQLPAEQPDLVFTGVEDMADYALEYKFARAKIKSASFPNLTTLSGIMSLYECFYYCDLLTSVSFPNLTTISGNTSMQYCFFHCESLTSASFPSLVNLSGNSCMARCFSGCLNITDIYFPALKTTSFDSRTNQFYNLLEQTGTGVIHKIHFPSNLETTIQGLGSYPLFGGTSGYVVLNFDLPATE